MGNSKTVRKSGTNTTGGKNEKWKPGIIGVIINQYKRICTINARKIDRDFAWQSRFYDRIIWNMNAFNNIRQYIVNNPLKWNEDRFYR